MVLAEYEDIYTLTMDEAQRARLTASFVSALDRCEHGRHRKDPCFGCPEGWSTGNLFLKPGQRIGTALHGYAIFWPGPDADLSEWLQTTGFIK